jgi:alpha-tubulin suppressor-like RCC1 family protein
VSASSGATAVTVGVATGDEQACEVNSIGVALCWGSNVDGQLGDGTFMSTSYPVDVAALLTQIATISAGNSYTCAVTVSGGVWCWGANFNVFGSSAKMSKSDTPVPVPGLSSGVAAVSAGDVQACAVTTSGAAECWGDNERGQLGDGSTTDSVVPVNVVGLGSGVIAVSAGGSFSCALTSEGAAKCWGANGNGVLGDGTTMDSLVPVEVSGL